MISSVNYTKLNIAIFSREQMRKSDKKKKKIKNKKKK